MPLRLRLATRGSPLARWQAEHVAGRLRERGHDVELVVVRTTGDARPDVPLHELGGQGVFVKEVEQALLDGRADLAVHSAKDLPSSTPVGLILAAFPERADARDALVGSTLADLRPGARVATGSARRRVQLLMVRSDVDVRPLRGNIHTRLDRLADHDAVVVACAALDRLGLGERATERLTVTVMVPQVGQGALAVEVRAGDEGAAAAVAGLDHQPTRRAVVAERAFLATLGGGCELPVGAHAVDTGAGLTIRGFLAGPGAPGDGRVWIAEHHDRVGEPEAVGRALAEELLAAGGAGALQLPGRSVLSREAGAGP